MKRIEFHDREKEIEEIMNILNTEPTLITFIYGSINSGKTELISHLIEQLPKEYIVFYVNFRGKFISDYSDFFRVLFRVEREKDYKENLKIVSGISTEAPRFKGIPVTKNVIDAVFKKSYEDVFEFLEDSFIKIAESRMPVLIIDELQVIKDIKIDEFLMYKLFNFFIRLTKELHLCHVFAITSDSLFIERIYDEAMLQGKCRYLLVDDFSAQEASSFLEKHGFNAKEKGIALQYCGGKPAYLVELTNTEDKEKKVNEMFMLRSGELETRLKMVKELGEEITIEGKSYPVNYYKLVDALKKFVDRDEVEMNEIAEVPKRYWVKKNVLFVDPLGKRIKPQSRLDLIAIQEVIKKTRKIFFILRR